MKYLELYEHFDRDKLSPLDRQFSDVVVAGLTSREDNIGDFWAIFNALKIELKDHIKTEDSLYKEMQYRIVDDQEPVEVMEDIISRIGKEKTPEMDRLLKKMADNNPYKYKEETYTEEDEEGMAR